MTNVSDELDTLKLSDLVSRKLAELDLGSFEGELETAVVEDFAIAVRDNIDDLENNLLVGMAIISVISMLLISWRAAVVIALFMFSVLAATILGLHAVGYSLNIITLFALILSLGLIVDDAVIVVESLDVAKNKGRSPGRTVRDALDKILLASLSGTLTTVLVFLPLAFVSGVLGDFIRLIPITVIVALTASFLLSIILIPVLARFSVLKEGRAGPLKKFNPLLKLEDCLGRALGRLPLLLRTGSRRGKAAMVLILAACLGFMLFSFGLAGQLRVSQFPPLKDGEAISYGVNFPDGYDLAAAEAAAADIDRILQETLPGDVERVNYITQTVPDRRQMLVNVFLKPLEERSARSPALVERFQAALDGGLDKEIDVFVSQSDAGPPALQYPFTMPIVAEDRAAAAELAAEIAAYLTGPGAPEFKPPGSPAVAVKETRVRQSPGQIERLDQWPVINLDLRYDQAVVDDPVLTQTEELIRERFDADYLEANGYDESMLAAARPANLFAESFDSLSFIFPIALLLIYVLLWRQFKTWFHPFIILTALPFAFVGVINWFFITDTPFSFFVMVGLVSLLGIAINNTILLVSYANFALKDGVSHAEAISRAVKERFRPLVITTMTTALALLPLAVNDFFWQDLAFTIIWGLVSSTLLVLLIFPYAYLLANRLLGRNKNEAEPSDDPAAGL